MKQEMLINAVHPEQKRMAVVDEHGKLIEFDIQMSFKQPTTGNIYKGVVLKVERGLQAAFVNYGGKKDGFLPLRDVGYDNVTEPNGKDGAPAGGRPLLKVGQELLVQVIREATGQKGALLTGYISLPGRYLVLLPNKESSGVSRKIEDEGDRQRLKDIVEQIKTEEGIGFIVRTAGMNRTKLELTRDYQHLIRLWQEIRKKAEPVSAPALIYQESDFGVRTLRDYFTPDITQIWVDDPETFKKMRAYFKAIVPRNLKMITLYKEKTSIFDRFQLEEQIRGIYQERVNLKSGGSLVIKPTEAMITIDVNSGRGSHKRNVEETAFKTNMEAAEEIARQLRLRDLGGLIVIDFIDMMDRKNVAEVEKTFKKALSLDRSRIQLARISKFGIMELSRQKKHSTIQEISYVTCPFCHGSGIRPSLEYAALSAFRKIESQAVKGACSVLKVSLPDEVAGYLLNQKRNEICHLETEYEMAINVEPVADMAWDAITIEATTRKPIEIQAEISAALPYGEGQESETGEAGNGEVPPEEAAVREETGTCPLAAVAGEALPKKKARRRRRHRHRKQTDVPGTILQMMAETPPASGMEAGSEMVAATVAEGVTAEPAAAPATSPRSAASRHRKKKAVPPPLPAPEAIPVVAIPDTLLPTEQGEPREGLRQNIPAETALPGRSRSARRRKKKAAHPLPASEAGPVVTVPDVSSPAEQGENRDVSAEAAPVEPARKPRRPYTRRKPKKAAEAPASSPDRDSEAPVPDEEL